MHEQLVRLITAADSSDRDGDPLSDDAINARRQSLESQESYSHSPVHPGSTFAGYEIHSLLGEGGMGAVYLATQERPSRQVALKILKSGFASERLRRRFELEAETLGKLKHPGIAQVYEAGIHDGQPYFAMEYIDGTPVTEYAERKQLGTRDKLKLISKIAAAIQHAHQHGIIHRDLKPANILIADINTDGQPSAQPKILDFGVAKVTESDIAVTTLQTDIGQLIGTISYMSPEQAGGNPDDVDTRSDVYAL
ncbi:MAG: serine/threonine protein kinase, partial [Phycisphaerales bacterium]|nr:serine/threonine protein kinase [Phycisphaerales bacterium]